MTLLHRRILYSLFFLVFFITAPIVILWAQGYRYNFSQHCLQKTGVLFLESKPSKANIFLNKKLQNETTTARLKNLLPDDYFVEVKKDNFQTWQKNLKVNESQTTFAQYIRLFKQNPKIENIFSEKIIQTSEKINDNLAIIYEKDKQNHLGILNFENQNLTELTLLNFTPEKIILSQDSLFILLITSFNENLIFDVKNKKIIDLTKITKQNIKKINWFKNNEDEIIYIQTNNNLLKSNLISNKSIVLISQPILDFYLINNSIFWLQKTSSQILLNKVELNNLKNIQTISTLPISDSYEFQKTPETHLSLLDKNNNIFYLIDIKDNTKQIFPEINYMSWSPNNKNILLINDFEIIVFDLEKQEKNLIVRLSNKILQTFWYPVSTHIIYLTNENIKAVENISDEKQFNILVNQKNIQQFFIFNKNKIYFINEQGINSAEIQ